MSGRTQKTERKKTKKVKGAEPKREVFFEEVLLAFLRSVGQTVGGIKNRGGAQTLGAVASSICATEALDVARNNANVEGYVAASAHALVAAMQQGGAWNIPLKPAPAPEQAPESTEKPSEPPEEATK